MKTLIAGRGGGGLSVVRYEENLSYLNSKSLFLSGSQMTRADTTRRIGGYVVAGVGVGGFCAGSKFCHCRQQVGHSPPPPPPFITAPRSHCRLAVIYGTTIYLTIRRLQ
jgi:hypothetical protein